MNNVKISKRLKALVLAGLIGTMPVINSNSFADEIEINEEIVFEEPVNENVQEEQIEKPIVEEEIEEPIVEETIEEPIVEEEIEESIVEEEIEEPIVEETIEEPIVEETIEEPIVEETTEEPVKVAVKVAVQSKSNRTYQETKTNPNISRYEIKDVEDLEYIVLKQAHGFTIWTPNQISDEEEAAILAKIQDPSVMKDGKQQGDKMPRISGYNTDISSVDANSKVSIYRVEKTEDGIVLIITDEKGNEKTISHATYLGKDPKRVPEDEPEDPEVDPEEPEVDPEDPEVDPEDPEVDPEDPEVDPEDPEVDPEDPEVDPEDPEVDPEDPEVDPEDPEVDPEDPEVDPEDPEVDPEDPEVDPEKDPEDDDKLPKTADNSNSSRAIRDLTVFGISAALAYGVLTRKKEEEIVEEKGRSYRK